MRLRVIAASSATNFLYHLTAGMMAVLKYEGFQDPNYNPLASRAEFTR